MRNKLLVAALVLVGVASVAYAAFAQTLTISGTGSATGTWDVAITNITQSSATGATDNTAPSFNATSATFDVNLGYPGATATYDVTVTNNGTIPAILDSITDLVALNAAAPTYITYSVTGVTCCKWRNERRASYGHLGWGINIDWWLKGCDNHS